ncbi:MAG: ATP-binding protein [Balneolales bacterium]
MRHTGSLASHMSLGDLKQLIKTGEGTYLEFKRVISSPVKIAREICAFANTKGGNLLIGVDDDKTIIGVESFYEQEFLLEQAAEVICSPQVDYSMEILPFYHRDIMLVKIHESSDKPIAVLNAENPAVFIRNRDKSVQASREAIHVLKNETSAKGVTFEFGPNERLLLRYLNEYEKITVREFSGLVNISKRKASKILVDLVSAGILRLFSHEKSDYFTLSHKLPS